MFSTVIDFGLRNAVFGGLSYVFCRAFSQSNPLEKAVLMTILVGLRELAEKAIESKYPAKTPFREFLVISSKLAAIPCTLYIGRQLNFKAADYFQIVGSTTIGILICQQLER